jgi:hypothetical protein
MRARLLSLWLLALGAAPAAAVELEPGWDARSAWDSNVFNSADDEQASPAVVTGPDFWLSDEHRNLRWNLYYGLRYEDYFSVSDSNAWQHELHGYGSWQASPRTLLALDQYYRHASDLGQLLVAGASPVLTEQQTKRTPFDTNDTTLTLVHALSPVTRTQLTGDYSFFKYDDDQRSDSWSGSANAQITRDLTPRQTVGFGAGVTKQSFDDTVDTPGRATVFYQGYGIWNYSITPSFKLSISAGPAWTVPDSVAEDQPATVAAPQFPVVRGSQGFLLVDGSCRSLPVRFASSNCATRDPGGTIRQIFPVDVAFTNNTEEVSGSLTSFGTITLEKTWEEFTARLSYQRSASASSGLSTSTNVDELTGVVNWRPSHPWLLTLLGSWSRQTSASDIAVDEFVLHPSNACFNSLTGAVRAVPASGNCGLFSTLVPNVAETTSVNRTLTDNAFEFLTYRFDFRASRQITPRFSVVSTATWIRQDQTGDFVADETVKDLRFELGFTWKLDPIGL